MHQKKRNKKGKFRNNMQDITLWKQF